jgi:ribosomal protein L32
MLAECPTCGVAAVHGVCPGCGARELEGRWIYTGDRPRGGAMPERPKQDPKDYVFCEQCQRYVARDHVRTSSDLLAGDETTCPKGHPVQL